MENTNDKKVNEANKRKNKVKKEIYLKDNKEKVIDREIAIVILKACGYNIPSDENEWKEDLEKAVEFLKNLSENQRAAISRPAKRIALIKIKMIEKGRKIDNEKLSSIEYIPLKDKKVDLSTYNILSENEKAKLREDIIMGIAGQETALKHFNK